MKKKGEINKELEMLFSESNEDNDKETKDQLVKKINKLKMLIKSNQECINKCKKTNDKNNILREVMEICFDKELIDELNHLSLFVSNLATSMEVHIRLF